MKAPKTIRCGECRETIEEGEEVYRTTAGWLAHIDCLEDFDDDSGMAWGDYQGSMY